MKKQVVVIAGPTGSGETTFTNELGLAFPQFERAVSATTRPPRKGEKNGEDYYFFSKEQFFEEVQEGNIPEYIRVKNRDAWYGSYKPDLDAKLAKGKIVIVNTDLSGMRYFKNHYRATSIFIKPKSLDVLRNRLKRRDVSISEHELDMRMAQATREIADAEHMYDYVVFNTDGEFADTMYDVVAILKREGYDV
jgi:guanylate kinase